MKKHHSSGFTILEVLIATTVFTIVLLICTYAVTRIGQLYFKGVTSSQIQDLTRKMSDEFSGQIQFGSSLPIPDSITGDSPTTPLIFCVGDNRYRAIMNRKLGDPGVDTVLQRIAYSGACVTTDTGFDGATELAKGEW
jgi:prepilin-type N-terminal cleavage/methylation domain-containing protein